MWLPGLRVGMRKVAAPVAVSGVVAMGVVAAGVVTSRRVRVPVGIPVVVVATWAVMVAGRVAGEAGRVRVVRVGLG